MRWRKCGTRWRGHESGTNFDSRYGRAGTSDATQDRRSQPQGRTTTYDLLQALTSKCEAIEAYAKYEQDASDENRRLFQELAKDEAKHAERLLDALKQQIR